MSVQISPTELASRLRTDQPPHLLDVRELEEHQLVALPNSKHIPLGQLDEQVEDIAGWKHEEVVVYCHHGVRSLHAIGRLRQLGFTQLRNLAGGIDLWSVEVDPACARY